MWLIGVEVEQETSATPPKKILDPPLTCFGELHYWRGRQWKTGCDNAPPVLSGDLSEVLL